MPNEPIEPWERGPSGFVPKANSQLETIGRNQEEAIRGASQVPRETRTILQVAIEALSDSQPNIIEVRRVSPNGTSYGTAFEVAKPHTLRHVVGNYEWPTSLDTTDTNQVEASDGTDTYTWIVTPLYQVGDVVTIQRVVYSGVNGSGGSDLKWLELSPSRIWGVDTS